VRFDFDSPRLEADKRKGGGVREHAAKLRPAVCRVCAGTGTT
jgi:hypothetical protein